MAANTVESLMVPVDKFPRISQDVTFSEAVLALDKALEEFMDGKREQRILLVYDNENRIVGKLTPIDVIRGLEPNYGKLVDTHASAYVSNFEYVIATMREQAQHLSAPWDDLCVKAKNVRVKEFLRKLTPAQVVQASDSLNEALHRFILGGHDSLFVTDGQKLVGVIRFSDVYREIQGKIKGVCKA
ncbi:CBS domain-containing protein [Desulfonatronum parangueonense]